MARATITSHHDHYPVSGGKFGDPPRHDLSGTAIGLPIRPGVVDWESIDRQSYGSPISRVWPFLFVQALRVRESPYSVPHNW